MEEGMAQRIKALRQEKGLTLEQVADVVGVGKSTVRKWETGMIANMKRDKIADLAKALGTTPAYLMGWDEDEENPYELEVRDAFDTLEVDDQIYVRDWIIEFAKNPGKMKNFPSKLILTEEEKLMLELFRKIPEGRQAEALELLRVALRMQQKP